MNEQAQRPAEEKAGRPGFGSSEAIAGWMLEIVPYGIFTTDRELRVLSWNEWLVTHSGRAAQDVIGHRLVEIFPDVETRRLHDRYARALDGEISVLSTALHKYLLPLPATVPASGLPHMLQTARIAPLPGPGGIAGTITIIEDVTQREFQSGILSRQQELDRLLSNALATLLQAAEPVEEMAGIFAAVRLALGLDMFVSYLVSPDEKTLQLNAAAGISPKQRESVAVLPFTEADRNGLLSGTSPTTLNVAGHVDAFRALGLLGRGSFALVVGTRVIGLVIFGSYERAVIATADLSVLSRIARYVAIALDRARRQRDTIAASRAKDDFLAALSHELRTPLNPVLLLASDSAVNPEFSEEAREAFRVIEKNALLEARLIDDLLDLTRIEHGKLGLELQLLDANSVLRDALETVRADTQEHTLALAIEPTPEGRVVVGDSGRLQQVFWNVLKNAVKFTPRGGSIAVTSAFDAPTGELMIKVVDTGIGMDQRELSRVFAAFTQGDHASQGGSHRFGGLGLGLAISRKLVELHGGRIEAASAGKDLGSSFTIFLPLTVASRSPLDLPVPSVEPRTSGALNAAARILLVEDHEPTRVTLQHLLARRGYEVVAVATAQSALNAAAAESFTLVLSDIGLPDGDGFSLMRRLRDEHGLKGIALTGYGMEEDLARSGDAGFFAHLTKPISVKVLDRILAQSAGKTG